MPDDSLKHPLSRRLTDQLMEARRELREQERTLARLKYEWGIAKRLRTRARSEDEREKWRIQSDVYMGMVLQQEGVIKEITQTIEHNRTQLAELGGSLAGETSQ